MKPNYIIAIALCASLLSCKSKSDETTAVSATKADQPTSFRIALGSCNRQDLPQDYWNGIAKDSADIFIWGGDNIYADTADMEVMKSKYNIQKTNEHYASFVSSLPYAPIGVWDDHDYGKNDAGKSWTYKDEAKLLFMDFFDIDSTHAMTDRGGTYQAKTIEVGDKAIKFYLLDTRYFRDALVDAEREDRRYQPHTDDNSTLLGDEQWMWLEQEFKTSEADFNIIVSSIQFLSGEHGFETWGNFPHEIQKMLGLIEKHTLNNILMLSGDRHISEFSQKKIEGLDYPLTDFTSSGLTHSYTSYDGEPNPHRVGEVVAKTSYGIIDLNFESEVAELTIKSTEDREVFQNLKLKYRTEQ